ncbi:MAG TPA: DUF423 domain-containing protein [Anaerolineales bacterium]|nr:DUF423 domain-containing protein [Anaerolineales bacterium]
MPVFVLLGGLSGGISVALGAFGAHALQSRLSPERLETFETGVRYQMYHALALLATAFGVVHWPGSSLPLLAGWAFVAGTLLFSGSLYLLVLTGKRWWGAITPFGGLAFILGWVLLAFTPFQ